MFKSAVWALFVLGIVNYTASAWATTEGWISGTVVAPDGVAVGGQIVQLLAMDGRFLKEVQSSETGEFQFFPLTFGDYQVVVKSIQSEPVLSVVHVASGAGSEIKMVVPS